MEHLKSETAYINEYQNLGYTSNYRVKNEFLVDVATKKEYTPKDIFIEKEFRFEGMSNPDDMSILYILKTKDERKGTVLANYSPSVSSEMAEFFAAIPKENFIEK